MRVICFGWSSQCWRFEFINNLKEFVQAPPHATRRSDIGRCQDSRRGLNATGFLSFAQNRENTGKQTSSITCNFRGWTGLFLGGHWFQQPFEIKKTSIALPIWDDLATSITKLYRVWPSSSHPSVVLLIYRVLLVYLRAPL